MILVTGACGFIGSNMVKSLLADGETVLAVDVAYKVAAATPQEGVTFVSSDDFRRMIRKSDVDVSGVMHLGACANTMETNESIMMEANVQFSREVFGFACWRNIPIVYASSAAVYGNSESCAEAIANENPINLYARSKLIFDNLMRQNMMSREHSVVGLRFFNVYGPGESKKGKMASMPYQMFTQIKQQGVCYLFGDVEGYSAGEQRRDFVHVEDVVSVMKFFAFNKKVIHGLFNVGAGLSRSFNDVANIMIDLVGHGRIEYVPFPTALLGKYQMNTCADIRALRDAGYIKVFRSVEEGIAASILSWTREG